MNRGRLGWLFAAAVTGLVGNSAAHAFPVANQHQDTFTNVEHVSFWGRPYPYGYTAGPPYTFGYAQHRRCAYRVVRDVPVDTPDGTTWRRVSFCR